MYESEYILQRRAKMLGTAKPIEEKKPIKIKPSSQKRQKQNREYAKVRKQFLIEHPRCQVKGCNQVSTECHHQKGRIGDLLINSTYFLAVCHDHHVLIECDPEFAKEQGYSQSRLKS